MDGMTITVLILWATAIFGAIQLIKSFVMLSVCARIFGVFHTMRYEHMTVEDIARRAKLTTDVVVRACIADKRFVRVVAGSYDVWTVEKQWRVYNG